ncbi:MAG: glycoside hydrolase family 15 protein [Thermoflavifilum aggregans]|nr:glycoside hydrolase family 15 protein [Thermoflavifilum aggregans]
MARHVYQTGIIGNCSYIAHVHLNTNIEWLCWPRFDSSFIFGGLLDKSKGGEFSIRPQGEFTSRQYYIDNTNVLVTEVSSAQGRYRVIDFAPRFVQYERYFKPLMLIRKIELLEGRPLIRVTCRPMGNYGQIALHPYKGSNHMEYHGLSDPVRLTTDVPLTYIDENKHFVLNENKYLVLTYGSPLEAPLQHTADYFLEKTIEYWRQWIQTTGIENIYQEEVIRSSLALKIHQFEDTGAIIAASTTSLPEADGSGRTWDYRYCWLRDAYYILQAFNHIGHFEELERYFHFFENIAVTSRERFQPLYSITGESYLPEREIDLEGYLGNKPVRIGNQAAEQIQNDTYGQVLVSLLPLYVDNRIKYRARVDAAQWVSHILHKIEAVMDEPDAGLWEFRNIRQYHCYTYLFHWAGACAAIKMADKIQHKSLRQLAVKLRNKAAEKIEQCYDPQRRVYTEAIGSKNLDASTLQLILMNYLDPRSQRAKDHLRCLEQHLKAEDGLFYRYKHEDDFGKPETTFLVTAFWYVEVLAHMGRVREAQENFEQLMKYTNHLGLLSEDVDARDGSQWGNFPQAYSHVGVMNAAYRIAKKIDQPIFL